MLWVTLALVFPFLLSCEFILESHFINSKIKNPFIYTMFIGSCRFLWLLLLFFVPLVIPKPTYLLIVFGASLGFFLALLFLYRAISIEEVSRVVPLTYLSPMFVLLFSAVFLKENLSAIQYFAIALLVSGAFLISVHPEKLRVSKTLWLMLLFLIFYGISSLLTKLFLERYSVFDYLIWVGTGTGIFSIIGLLSKKKEFASAFGKLKAKSLLLLVPILAFWITSAIVGNYATQLGPISLVSALGSSGAAYSLLLAFAIDKIKPGFLKESFSPKNLLLKATAVCLIIAGTILIYI